MTESPPLSPQANNRRRLLLALLLPFLALALQWLWWDAIKPRWFVLFYPAVIFSGWLAGFAGGIGATLLSLALMTVFFIAPSLAPDLASFPFVQCLVFATVGCISAYFHHRARHREQLLTDTQKQLQQALTTANHNVAYAQALFEQAPIGMAIVDADSGRFIRVNPCYCDIVGWPAESLLATTWMAITHAEDVAQGLAAKNQLSSGETNRFEHEKRYLRADDTLAWTQITVAPLYNDSGQRQQALVMAEDIAARKQLQQQLRTAKQELDAIFDSAGVGMAYIRNHTVVRCNNQLEQLFGYSHQALIGQSTRQWFADNDMFDTVERAISQAIANGQTFSRNLPLLRKDGSIFWVKFIAHAVDKQDPDKGILKIIQDISDERAACDELRYTKNQAEAANHALQAQQQTQQQLMQRLSLATTAANIGIWIWHIADNRVEWDSRMCELYGLSAEECSQPFSYNTWRSRLHPDDRADAEAALQDAIKHHTSYDYTFRIVLPDGSVRYISAATALDCDDNGQAIRMVGVNRDVTQQHQHQQLLEQAKQVAESANNAKSDFLANMSHEIRTPLNAIIGLSSLLRDTDLNPHQRNSLDKIGSASKMLLNLINDILDYSKIEAGYLQFEKALFCPADAIRNTVALFRVKLNLKALTIKTVLARNLPAQVIGDSLRLEQVLNNLLGNAVKFTDQGEICISARTLDKQDIANAVWIEFCIRDSGIGIPADAINQLFAPFTQADSSISRRYGGTGLGLSISQKLVALMGGSMTIDSAPGQGCTICFTARFEALGNGEHKQGFVDEPTRDEAAIILDNQQAITISAPLAGAHILVVEDDPLNQLVAKGFLEKLQLQVTVANNGVEALRCIENQAFDAVLLDIQMPEMDGFETAKALRKDYSAQQLPIIALTASAMTNSVERCLAAGMNDHLAKPINPLRLANCLAQWLKPHNKPASSAQAQPTNPAVMPLSADETQQLQALLDALEPLLMHNMLQAKTVVDSIEQLLAHSALAVDFQPISQLVRHMRFKQAQATLETFTQQLHLSP